MKINLGCSDALLPDWVNLDIADPGEKPADIIFVQADLNAPWPFVDSTVEELRAHDLIEHLTDKIHTMNEAWRVLRPRGRFEIEVPTTDGPGAFQDPTHVSFWHRNSFFYYTHGDPHRERFGTAYGINARFRILFERLTAPWGIPKLQIVLEAVK